MSSEHVGIEDARKRLGDLVAQVQDGPDVILTRSGRPVARITAYQPEDTMATIDLTQAAAAVISRARSNSGMTAPEFDYDISVHGIGGLFGSLASAAYEIANEHLPHVAPGAGEAALAEREANRDRLWENLQPELERYAERCRARKYTGWSAASRSRGARISYA